MNLTNMTNRALRKIGAYGIGETPDSADVAVVQEAFTLGLAQLKPHNLDVWTLTDTPEELVEPFIEYCLPLFAAEFEYPIQDSTAAQKIPLARLKDLISPRRLTDLKQNEYF